MRTLASILSVALVACAHSEPPSAGPGDLELPFVVTAPLRLTWSPGLDRTPQWSPTPGRVMYAYAQDPVPSGTTGCVADLPAGGGSRGAELCDTDIAFAGTIMRPYWPARHADGTTVMVRQRWGPLGLAPFFSDLAITLPGEGQATTTVIPIPYFSAGSGRSHQGISHLSWLDRDHLVYIGQGVIRSLNENIETGYEIMILDPADSLAGLSTVPGTNYASSVSVGGTSDTIYYTIGGDSMVYRRTLSTGVVDTVADFGSLGIARDVRVAGGKLVAVVGGNVSFGPHATLGMAQLDFGGPIYAIDLTGGPPTLLTETFELWRHPALAPDGSRLVAARVGDLWAIAVP